MKNTIQQLDIIKNYELPKGGAAKMTDEALVARRDEVKAVIKALETILATEVDPELFNRAEEYPEDKYPVENRTVVIVPRPIYSTANMSYCRRKGAIKEVPDSDVLKKLYEKGTKIPGLKVTRFVTVK